MRGERRKSGDGHDQQDVGSWFGTFLCICFTKLVKIASRRQELVLSW